MGALGPLETLYICVFHPEAESKATAAPTAAVCPGTIFALNSSCGEKWIMVQISCLICTPPPPFLFFFLPVLLHKRATTEVQTSCSGVVLSANANAAPAAATAKPQQGQQTSHRPDHLPANLDEMKVTRLPPPLTSSISPSAPLRELDSSKLQEEFYANVLNFSLTHPLPAPPCTAGG